MNMASGGEVVFMIYSREMTLKTNEYESIYKNRHRAPWSKRLGDSHIGWAYLTKASGITYEDTHTLPHAQRTIHIRTKWRTEGKEGGLRVTMCTLLVLEEQSVQCFQEVVSRFLSQNRSNQE